MNPKMCFCPVDYKMIKKMIQAGFDDETVYDKINEIIEAVNQIENIIRFKM